MPGKSFESLYSAGWLSKYRNYMPLQWPSFESDVAKSTSPRRVRALLFVLASILLVFLVVVFFGYLVSVPSVAPSIQHSNTTSGWVKPPGLTIVALIFYGRRANVQILERYLRVMFSLERVN
jgi:hypothetical protein